MANVDDILSDVWGALGLPDGAMAHHVVLAVEYSVPGGDKGNIRRLTTVMDEEMPPWLVQGICSFVIDKVVEDMMLGEEDEG